MGNESTIQDAFKLLSECLTGMAKNIAKMIICDFQKVAEFASQKIKMIRGVL